jgi:hypothetical protein
MLKILRHKNVSKIALWAILILILPSFVMWGAGGMGKSKEKGPTFVGKINGDKVSFEDFSKSLSSTKCQIILNYFNNTKILDELLKSQALLGKVAWDRLIMSSEARKLKIKVSDSEVISYVRSHPMFSRGGAFDAGMYAYILRNNLGLDARTFEEMVRNNLAMQKLNEIETKGITVSDEEAREFCKSVNGDFEKDKATYVKNALNIKKNKYLEAWMRELEKANTLNINLDDYEKYYR